MAEQGAGHCCLLDFEGESLGVRYAAAEPLDAEDVRTSRCQALMSVTI
jgi:hypothetical protein